MMPALTMSRLPTSRERGARSGEVGSLLHAPCYQPVGSLSAQWSINMHDASPYFVGWGTLALINAGLAQGKRRSGLNWFLLSLLLGPVATFLLVAFCEPLDRE